MLWTLLEVHKNAFCLLISLFYHSLSMCGHIVSKTIFLLIFWVEFVQLICVLMSFVNCCPFFHLWNLHTSAGTGTSGQNLDLCMQIFCVVCIV